MGKTPKTPDVPSGLLTAWIVTLIVGQLALAFYFGKEWPVAVWTLAWLGVAVVYERHRFARWWATRRYRSSSEP